MAAFPQVPRALREEGGFPTIGSQSPESVILCDNARHEKGGLAAPLIVLNSRSVSLLPDIPVSTNQFSGCIGVTRKSQTIDRG
jgi:hypothetical protein